MLKNKKGKPKIAFLLPKLINSAPIVYNKNLIENLQNDFDITVFYFSGEDSIGFTCKTQKIDFKKRFNFEGFNLIQSFGYRPDVFLAKNRKFIKAKLVTTLHSFIYKDLRSQFGLLASIFFGTWWLICLRQFDEIVCLTNVMRDYYSSIISVSKLKVIYSSHVLPVRKLKLADSLEKKILDFKADKILLGVVANLTRQKGVDHVIKGISQSDSYRLVILGEGKYRKSLEKMASDYGCENKCLFLGHVEEGHKYMPLMDIYILCSYQEGFGLVGLEAAYYSLPIVCNDIPVFKEIYETGNVEYYQSNSLDTFILALDKVAKNINSYGVRLNEFCRTRYRIENMSKQYFDLYTDLIK